jgi:hypothetical protein
MHRGDPVIGILRLVRTARRRDDSGVVAVVVALCIAGFVFPISALAVDLGMLYSAKAQLADAADQAAKAGAQWLPDVIPARAAALNSLCSTANTPAGWSTAVCGDTSVWPDDGLTENGEISFFEGTTSASTLATTIRVIAPPALVGLTFARIFTTGTPLVQQRGSASIGTPLGPIGMAPLFLLPGDLGTGSFCALSATAPAGAGGTGCIDATAIGRGFIAERRLGSSTNLLERNLKSGVDPTVHVAAAWPCSASTAVSSCRAPWPAGVDCLASPSPGLLFASPLLGPPTDDVNCVRAGVATSSFGSGTSSPMIQLRRGLISTNSRGPARLSRSCGGLTYPGRYHSQSGIDSSRLFTPSAPWIDQAVTPLELAAAQAAIASGQPNPLPGGRPLFSPKIFECPRFSVAPVVDSGLPVPVSTPVTGLRYLWIGSDDETTAGSSVENGLIWGSSTTMLGVKGYVFDASYLPAGPRIGFDPGPFLGNDLASVVSLTDPSGLP